MPPAQTGQNALSFLTMQSVITNSNMLMDVQPTNVINLAKKALSASKEAALLAERYSDLGDSVSTRFVSFDLSCFPVNFSSWVFFGC